jgi:alkylation response protein AidB-like acyl-CoA dehydrogenase
MQLALSDDQRLLLETSRRFLDRDLPASAVRRLAENYDQPWVARNWTRAAELGWAALTVPTDQGGTSERGEGIRNAVLIAEELGRRLYPGPFVSVTLVADAIARNGSDSQRADILFPLMAGETIASWVGGGPTRPLLDASPGGGLVLNGMTNVVPDAGLSAWLLIAAADDAGSTQVLLPTHTAGITVDEISGIDPLRPTARIRFDEVRVEHNTILGERGAANAEIERRLQLALLLQCAETMGGLEHVLQITLAYSLQRYSFGRQIGSYQALKHRLANSKVAIEAGHAVVAAAAAALEANDPGAAQLISAAKAHVGECSMAVIQDCIQLHGGIGVTWEHELHLFLRRATVNRALYGSPAEHLRRLAADVLRPAV